MPWQRALKTFLRLRPRNITEKIYQILGKNMLYISWCGSHTFVCYVYCQRFQMQTNWKIRANRQFFIFFKWLRFFFIKRIYKVNLSIYFWHLSQYKHCIIKYAGKNCICDVCVREYWLKAAASAADLTVTPERRIACSVSDEPNRSFSKERTQNRISAFFFIQGWISSCK